MNDGEGKTERQHRQQLAQSSSIVSLGPVRQPELSKMAPSASWQRRRRLGALVCTHERRYYLSDFGDGAWSCTSARRMHA